MTTPNTQVLIRVQARGGKYLGPNVQYAQVSIYDGGKLIYGPVTATGGSGTVVTGAFPANASPDAIVVTAGVPPPGAYWLTPDTSSEGPTAGVTASLALSKPAFLEFRATALANSVNAVTSSTTMWVYPRQDLTIEPGVLITMPGLVVNVAATVGTQVQVTGTVTMMCGCPITTPTWPQGSGPEPYWPYPEFEVFAVLTAPDGTVTTQVLGFASENTFTGSLALPPAGTSTLGVCAIQRAASNVGYAEIPLVVS